ncbi:MAG: acyltransferase [Pseudomonadota bacterium]
MFLLGSSEQKYRQADSKNGESLSLITLLRAVAAITILWHHYAIYPPLREWASPLLGDPLDWLQEHARATQVFFVIGGYVLARSLAHHKWTLRGVSAFMVSRYLRLGIPYVAVIVMTIPILTLARGWVPDEVLGQPISIPQFLAHLFFLQGVLGYEQLSAGLWFVCINFQMCFAYVVLLWIRDSIIHRKVDLCGLLGWGISIASLFYFNLDEQWDNWFLYFFPYFFFGVVIQRSRERVGLKLEFWLYLLLLLVAMLYEWRWRLGIASAVGLIVFLAETTGHNKLPVKFGLVRRLGDISYSLFLVHFPVLLLVATLWAKLNWTGPTEAAIGLLVAFIASIVAAEIFFRFVETPSALAGRKKKKQLKLRQRHGAEVLEAG